MKHKILLLIISGVLLCMIYCRKGNTDNAYELTGKWQEIKVRARILDSGKITHDTTYLRPFTNLDYIQFKSSDSCAMSIDHYYYSKIPQLIPQSITNASYVAIGGAKFVIDTQSTLATPGGFVTADTIYEINTNNILIHSVFYSQVPDYESITDTYYQK